MIERILELLSECRFPYRQNFRFTHQLCKRLEYAYHHLKLIAMFRKKVRLQPCLENADGRKTSLSGSNQQSKQYFLDHLRLKHEKLKYSK